MSKLSRNIAYNFFGRSFSFLFNFILGLFSVKYIFNQLGEDALGIIYFMSTVDLIMLASIRKGISNTAIREISSQINDNPGYVNDFVRTWSFLCWGGFVLFGAMIYFLAPMLAEKWIHLKTMNVDSAIYIMRILGIAAFLALPKSFYISLLTGLQRMEFTNLITVASAIIQRLGTIFIIVKGGNVYQVIYWIGLCYFLQLVASFSISAFFVPLFSFIPKYSSKVIKTNINFGLNMIYISILDMIQNKGDRLILSKLLPIGSLGYYSVAYNNISRAKIFTSAISEAAFPALCETFGGGQLDNMISRFNKLQDFVCFFTVPIFAAIPFAAFPVFSFVFNYKIAETLMLPISLLSLGFFMNSTLSIPYKISLAVGRPDITVRQSLYSFLTVFPLTIVFILVFGITGAALGCVSYFLFCYIYSIPRIFKECLKKPTWHYYKSLIIISIITGSTYGMAWILIEGVFNRHILSLSIAYSTGTIAYFAATFFFAGEELRNSLLHFIHKLIKHLYGKTNIYLNGVQNKF